VDHAANFLRSFSAALLFLQHPLLLFLGGATISRSLLDFLFIFSFFIFFIFFIFHFSFFFSLIYVQDFLPLFLRGHHERGEGVKGQGFKGSGVKGSGGGGGGCQTLKIEVKEVKNKKEEGEGEGEEGGFCSTAPPDLPYLVEGIRGVKRKPGMCKGTGEDKGG